MEKNNNCNPCYMTTNTLLSDNLDSGTVGSPPIGWTLNTSGGTVTIQAVPCVADKSMRMYKSVQNSDYAAASKNFTQQTSGIVTIDSYVMVPETGSTKQIMVRDYAGVGIAGLVNFTDGNITANITNNLQSFAANTWYHITLKLNVSTKKYEVLIDGASRGTFDFYNTGVTNIGEVLYVISPSYMGSLYVNSIKVVK